VGTLVALPTLWHFNGAGILALRNQQLPRTGLGGTPGHRSVQSSKELRRLEREGLFVSEVSGRQKYFQLNRQYRLFEEIRGIVAKTIGAIAN